MEAREEVICIATLVRLEQHLLITTDDRELKTENFPRILAAGGRIELPT
jgi:hypothetical protein